MVSWGSVGNMRGDGLLSASQIFGGPRVKYSEVDFSPSAKYSEVNFCPPAKYSESVAAVRYRSQPPADAATGSSQDPAMARAVYLPWPVGDGLPAEATSEFVW